MRKLKLNDAVFIGTASMVGAGIFTVFAPAASFAGDGLIWAVVIAGAIALLNARSMAQLARQIPRSGGAYSYAAEILGRGWGFTAGAAFLIGKTGSVAAIALTVSNYLGFELWAAVAAIWLMFLVNVLGVNRTALGAKILSGITLFFLVGLLLASMGAPVAATPLAPTSAGGVLTAAGLVFFAFAGYARVATLGSEVIEPERTVPRAIGISLGLVFVLYLALAFAVTRVLGSTTIASERPIFDLAQRVGDFAGGSIVAVAVIASLGSLLALLAGMGRLGAVMGSEGELPKALGQINSRGAPWLAELLFVTLATVLVLSGSIVFTIGLSSFAVLIYYAIANLAALKSAQLGLQRIFSFLGLIAALVVAIAVPVTALILGFVLLALALLLRWGMTKLG